MNKSSLFEITCNILLWQSFYKTHKFFHYFNQKVSEITTFKHCTTVLSQIQEKETLYSFFSVCVTDSSILLISFTFCESVLSYRRMVTTHVLVRMWILLTVKIWDVLRLRQPMKHQCNIYYYFVTFI